MCAEEENCVDENINEIVEYSECQNSVMIIHFKSELSYTV